MENNIDQPQETQLLTAPEQKQQRPPTPPEPDIDKINKENLSLSQHIDKDNYDDDDLD